jgi:hypothetical protein
MPDIYDTNYKINIEVCIDQTLYVVISISFVRTLHGNVEIWVNTVGRVV